MATDRVVKFAAVLIFLFTFIGFAIAQDSTPPRLLRFNGSIPGVKGSIAITAALYRDQYGGVPLWLETHLVVVDEPGRYSVVLGSNSAEGLPLMAFTSSEARWIGIRPNGMEEQPRVLLLSVPYALKAMDANTVGGLTAEQLMAAPQPVVSLQAAAPQSTVTVTRPGRKARTVEAEAPPPSSPRGSFFMNSIPAVVIEAYDDAAKRGLPLLLNPQGGNIGVNTSTPQQALSVAGTIESTSGGFKFPDGSTQAVSVSQAQLNASNLSSGTVPSAQLTGTYSNPLVFNNVGNIYSGNGGALSNVNAVSLNGIAAGNYARRDVSNSFSGNQTFSGKLGVATTPTAEAIEVAGNIKLTGAVKFADGTSMQSALSLIPAGFTILGSGPTAPTGYTSAGWSTVMNPAAWSRKASMPSPQSCGAYGLVNGKLYIISGFTDMGLTPGLVVQEYDPAADKWISKKPALTARVCPGSAVVNNRIYVFGGYAAGGAPIASVEEYTPATESWATKTPLPVAVGFPTAAAVGNKIYIFGGDTSGACCSPTNAVNEYDTVTNSWRAMDPMPVTSRSRSAAVFAGKVYLFGGAVPYTNETDVFDPAAAPGLQWKTKTPRPNTCEASPTIVYNDMIFMFACWYSPVATAPVDVYVPGNDTWVSAPPVPRGASAYNAGMVGGLIYITAGGTNTQLFTDTYQLDPAKVIMYLYTKD